MSEVFEEFTTDSPYVGKNANEAEQMARGLGHQFWSIDETDAAPAVAAGVIARVNGDGIVVEAAFKMTLS